MTGALHVTEEIHLGTPRNQQLAVIWIGKVSHSVPAIPLRESQADVWRKFPLLSGRGCVDSGKDVAAGMARRLRRTRRFLLSG